MGIGVENCTVRQHRPAGGSDNDYVFHRHYGTLGIDSVSPAFNHAAWTAIAGAAVNGTQGDFDDACTDAMGQWYSGLPAPVRAVFKANVARTLAV